eukprot:gnl/TRDRNA2_/TRDRNA2_128278_c0_seq1.p1 gnl/TRDRNA2_/TRDRNA2_128278_c0~~gnl/TRDRNA2_/TRDRNA2_128278_c0_seq1.p1  ORF type:complete len:584 (+),score=106.21 gnl/TRDRNA2_/TRDRNA2_128278_c0_seq1:76-1752(+)
MAASPAPTRDVDQMRTEMAQRLRQNLTDQMLRSEVRQRCGSQPSTPGRFPASSRFLRALDETPSQRLGRSASQPSMLSTPGTVASAASAVASFASSQQASSSSAASTAAASKSRRRASSSSGLSTAKSSGRRLPWEVHSRAQSPVTSRRAPVPTQHRRGSGDQHRASSSSSVPAVTIWSTSSPRSTRRAAAGCSPGTTPPALTLTLRSKPVPMRGRRGQGHRTVGDGIDADGGSSIGDTPASSSPVGGDDGEASPPVELPSGGGASQVSSAADEPGQPSTVQLQRQVKEMQERVAALEREQRHLISVASLSSQAAPADLSTVPCFRSLLTPTASSPNSARGFSSQVSKPPPLDLVDDLGAGASTSPMNGERPEWLLADGRLLTARLEGENLALRRAVARAKRENTELAERQRRAEERNRTLELDNLRVSQELLPAALRSAAVSAADGPSVTAARSGKGEAILTSMAAQEASDSKGASNDAVASLRRAVLGGQDENLKQRAPEDAQNDEARRRLLGTSIDIGRRMEDILSRREKLRRDLLDAETEAGSSAPSGSSAESI